MPRRVIKQPNGNLAIFSDIADMVVYYDCEPDDVVDILINEYDHGPKTARQKVQNGIEDHKPWKVGVPGTGRERWDDDMYHALLVHGIDSNVPDILIECGMSAAEVDAWKVRAAKEMAELEAEDQ
jgi:hypothetical protein